MVFRVIPRLDIKPPNLVKGINLEGVRKLGNPTEFARRYYSEGADELFYQDVVASLYGRTGFMDMVTQTANELFVPLTVGGGLRKVEDVQTALRHGADKVCLNTQAITHPEFIREASEHFGSQCIVVAIEVIPYRDGRGWEPLYNNGREQTGLDAEEWAHRAVELGAGELLITSIHHEGTKKGFDFEFGDRLVSKLNVPVVLHGGAGSPEDVVEAAKRGYSGAAISSILHYQKTTINDIKEALDKAAIPVRI
jgi:imidazole glycerol-phosphate synthase subunit HisF